MRQCPFCGVFNDDAALSCKNCREAFPQLYQAAKRRRFGPDTAKAVRNRALSGIALGLLMKVYWGGYGPWPLVDNPTLTSLRAWAEPALLFGGAAIYVVGWILQWI